MRRPPALLQGDGGSAAGRARRAAIARMGLLALSLAVTREASGATILAVRLWPARDYTRVTVESDEPLQASHFLTETGPPRLVIDIEDLTLDRALRELVGKVRSDDPFIAGLRVGQVRPQVVRLVLDLKQPVAPQRFALPPFAFYRHRLVLDLHPTIERDPLLELVREKEAAERKATQALSDALGAFIAGLDRPVGGSPGGVSVAPGATSGPAPAGEPAKRPTPPAPPAPSVLAGLDRLVIVALDPGHGGEDPGAIGPGGLREKDVVLRIALQLRERLHQEPGLRVMMTRDADYFVPLHERVRKARRVQADLFVSIHADAYIRPEARGGSVFALSTGAATSSTARWMADKENAADLVGGVNVAVRDAHLLRTMLDISTAAQIKDSLVLGEEVLSRLGRVGRLHKRRVEQAGFAVLKAPDIPSILVETAFISNPEEERLLQDLDFQTRLVDALAQGIHRYFLRNPPLARQRRV